jgi:hypothetical protein
VCVTNNSRLGHIETHPFIIKCFHNISGGVVGIQTVTALGGRSGGIQKESRDLELAGAGGRNAGGNNKDTLAADEVESTNVGPQRRLQKKLSESPSSTAAASNGGSLPASEELSSAAEKSLVTATVQYPVSATPTRVDLAAFQKAYMSNDLGDRSQGGGGGGQSGSGGGSVRPTSAPHDADMIVCIFSLIN